MKEIQLYDYQERAVEQLREGIRAGHKRQILVAPTGSGKTEIASYMLQRKGARALFIVDRVTLVDQTSERFDEYGIPHGVIQAGHWRCRPYEQLQVCSAQTLERRGLPDDVSVVFVDEAHCMREKITEYLCSTDAVVIGLTATPFAKGLGRIYSHAVNVSTTNELIQRGYLVPLKMYAARAINVEGMKVVAGEWSDKDIEARGMEILGDIVSEWKAKTDHHFGGPVKTIVFSATVKHGEELCRQFQEAGYNFQQISYRDGGDEQRRELIKEFRKPDSAIHGLVSCEVFTKGFDVKDVLCGISARPYRKSLSAHIQQMGRVMRKAPGKTFGLWLDHSGNALRFMTDVADIFENGCGELDDGKREAAARKEPTKKEREEIRCSCGYVMQPWDRTCPGCGKARQVHSMIETLPGQMVALPSKAAPKGLEDRGNVWLQLCTEARRSNPGDIDKAKRTALAQYKSIFGEWPSSQFDPYATVAMTSHVKNRILRSRIAWSKGRGRQQTSDRVRTA